MRALRVYGTVFLATAVPFGLGMVLLFGVLTGGDSDAWRTGAAAGLLFGLAMAAILGTLQLVGSRGVPRGASLGARQELRVPVQNGPHLAHQVVAALRSLPAEVTAVDVVAGRYVARRGVSWTTWGEELVVQLEGDPARPVAVLSSRPQVRTTLVDFGRGRRNVEQLARALTAGSWAGSGPAAG